MSSSKQMTMAEAVDRLIPDGSVVAASTCLETLIPFAAGREIIRQRKKGLTLVGPISDIFFDQIVGAGCARKIQAAWVGNVITGTAYHFRRAVENRTVEIEDHSNLTLAMALKAGALGVPYLPVRTALGSDLLRSHPSMRRVSCPFTGMSLVAVAAIRPDVAVVHVQRSDDMGNALFWGNLGVTRDACLASRRVLVTTEEIVAADRITRDPNRVLIPGFKVDAVVHAPWGGHPSPVPGYYNRDHRMFLEYREENRDPESGRAWRMRWIEGNQPYVQRVGTDRLETLKIRHSLLSEPVEFGY